MPRAPSGESALQRASEVVAKAKNADDLRTAMAVLLPLRFEFTIKETASAIGRSSSWVSLHRRRFIKEKEDKRLDVLGQGGRRNEIMPASEEDAFMDQVCDDFINVKVRWQSNLTSGPKHYAESRLSFVDKVQRALVKLAERPVSRATAYNLMARVGGRRFEFYQASHWVVLCNERTYAEIQLGKQMR